MSDPWHDRPGRVPSDAPGPEFLQKPPHPGRTGGYHAAPRHSTTPTQHRTGTATGEWGPVADRRPPQQPVARRTRRLDASPWHWLLLVPIVVPLIPGLYNRIEPTLFGLPFFFWSQLAFAFLASGVIAFVHLKVR